MESDQKFVPITWKICVLYIWTEECFFSVNAVRLYVFQTTVKSDSTLTPCKIVNGYTQQVQITGLLFGDNVFVSRNLSKKSLLEIWR